MPLCDGMAVTPSTINAAMNCSAAMVIDEIATREGISPEEAAFRFLSSETARRLFDDSLKLWWDGPSTIADDYLEEVCETGDR